MEGKFYTVLETSKADVIMVNKSKTHFIHDIK